ncbi:uncharacterized protein [Hetaerina americana]|uniref:uncharacterized protein n=1 Tax=Hetaerina americana TaxID=62018 RepID=UPI003A7F5A4A
MGLAEGRATLLLAAVALMGAARGEPKPVVVQYQGGGTAPEQQPAAEGLRATALLQRDGGPPRAGYFLPPRWYPVGPEAARRPEEGAGVPRGGSSDGRGYSLGQADGGYRWEEAAPHFDASYNGIVRRAGIREDGQDYQGEPGVYAIRGGVFPGDYNGAQGGERAYVFRQPLHLPPDGAVPYTLVRTSGYPYVYNAAARSGPLGYSPEIQTRGEQERRPGERRVYYVGRGEGGDDANYVGVVVGRHQGAGTGYNGDTGRFAEHQDDRGVDHQQHRQQFQHHPPQQHQYAQRQPQERRQEALYPGRREEGAEDGAYREVPPVKVPVRGVAPRAFYEAEGGARGRERYN